MSVRLCLTKIGLTRLTLDYKSIILKKKRKKERQQLRCIHLL